MRLIPFFLNRQWKAWKSESLLLLFILSVTPSVPI
jgi:hypothetical protein